MFEKRYKSHHDVKDVINKLTKKSIVTPFTFNKLLNEEPENKEKMPNAKHGKKNVRKRRPWKHSKIPCLS